MIIDSGIATGSLAVSGSFLVSGSSYLNGDIDITGSLTVSGLIIGALSGSVSTSSLALNSELLGGLDSGSFQSTASFNDFSSSVQTRITDLEEFSSSLDANFATDAELNAATASLQAGVTASINDLSSSIAPQIAGLQVTASVLTSASASFANEINNIVGVSGSYATTGSNVFKGNQTIYGNLFMSGSNRLIYNNNSDNTMLFGFFDGSNIYGPYYQIFGGQYSNLSQRGSAEFVYDVRNNADADFHIASFNGSTWIKKFVVNDSGAQVTGSLSTSGTVTANSIDTPTIYSDTATVTVASSNLSVPNGGITTNFNVVANGGFTGSFSGSLYNLQNTVLGHIPFFSQSQILVDSAIIQVDNGLDQGYSIAINQNGVNTDNPEALFVYQASTSSFNVISGKGNLNNYLQLNIQNLNNGADASSDVVATANNGDENSNYIDMGINNANFAGPIGNANDAYLYSTGQNLHIGNVSNQPIQFFVSGTNSDNARKFELNPNNQHNMTGSLKASNGFIGNLTGNASTATTASNALTASSADSFFVRNNATVANTLTAQTLIVQTVTSSIVYSSGSNIFGNQLTNSQELTGSVSITGSLQVNGLTPVYTNQTSSLTALSASYASTASYAQTAPAYVTTASYNQDSASFSTRDTNLEVTASSLVNASASFSTRTTTLESASASFALQSGSNSIRLTNLESTASSLTAASASFALVSASYSSTSGSLSTRTTNLESTSSQLIIASGSFSIRTTNLESTASSLVNASASFSTRVTNTEATASTLTAASASFAVVSASYSVASSSLSTRVSKIEGNYATTGSNVFVGNQTLTGSLFQSGALYQIGDTVLSGSLVISGSQGTGIANINIYGDTHINGNLQFNPVNTNINNTITGSYIYVSGSTQDLYFTQNGAGYANTTRLRWIEGNLYTGLLNGGLITSQSSTVYQISSGSGIIVNLNASLNDNPYPTIQYINWGNLTQNIANLSASYDQQFVGIQSDGTIYAQGVPFTDGQLDTLIQIGVVLHQNHSTINGVTTAPQVAYGLKQNENVFISAFGPLKLSGYTLSPSGSSTGSLVVGNGTAYLNGGNYAVDPNNPSYITGTGATTSKIFRYYDSGSSWVYDTNNGAGYATIDPTNYSNNGVLTPVGAGNWSIQRAFFFPTSPLSPKPVVVYYGNAVYATQADAIANIPFETFVEAPNTAANAIYLGAIVISGNGVFTNSNTYKILPGGLFRQTGGTGGGGSTVTQTLTGLSDVSISGPTDLQPFAYSTTAAKWINTSTISASLAGNATSATSASYASTSSWAITAINADTASYVTFAQTASYVTFAQTASYVLNAVSSSYALTAPYYVLTASYSTDSSSFSTRVTNTEVTASNLVAASASFSTRVTNSELTGSSLVNASASFSTRTTNLESTASSLVVASASFVTDYVKNSQTSSMTVLSASYALTASYALNGGGTSIDTSSFVKNDQTSSMSVATASYALTASYVTTAQTASYTLYALTASYALNGGGTSIDTSSFVKNDQTSSMSVATASYALTASFATDFTASNVLVTGVLTAQTLVVQTITSSIEYSSGSNILGSLLTDNQQLTGSVTITGSLLVNGDSPLYISQTSSLSVTSASYAATASYANATAVIPFNIGGTSTYYGTVNSSNVGSNNVFTLDTGSYTAAFYKYTLYNGANARSGEVMAAWNNDTVNYTDVSTTDIGSTVDVTSSVSIVASQVQFNFQTNTSGWIIKSQATLI